jgi:hypothetical protein
MITIVAHLTLLPSINLKSNTLLPPIRDLLSEKLNLFQIEFSEVMSDRDLQLLDRL